MKGKIDRVSTKPTSKSGIFSLGLHIGDTWYNTITKFPDNLKVGDEITFDLDTSDERNKNVIKLGTLKRTMKAVTTGSPDVSNEIMEALNKLTKRLDAMEETIKKLDSGIPDDIQF